MQKYAHVTSRVFSATKRTPAKDMTSDKPSEKAKVESKRPSTAKPPSFAAVPPVKDLAIEKKQSSGNEPLIANISMPLPTQKEPTSRDLRNLQSKLNQWRLQNLLL